MGTRSWKGQEKHPTGGDQSLRGGQELSKCPKNGKQTGAEKETERYKTLGLKEKNTLPPQSKRGKGGLAKKFTTGKDPSTAIKGPKTPGTEKKNNQSLTIPQKTHGRALQTKRTTLKN